jgi:hypothetical protein
MRKSNVNPSHHKVAGRARQGELIAQTRNRQKYAEAQVRERTKESSDAGQTRSANTAARKTRVTLRQAPPGHKRGHNLVPGRSAPHARFSKAARSAALRPPGAAPQRNAKQQAATPASVTPHGTDKRAKRSMAQEHASHHEFDPMPATNAFPGAFGKRPPPRRLPMRK